MVKSHPVHPADFVFNSRYVMDRYDYRNISNIRRTKSSNLIVSRLVFQVFFAQPNEARC